MKIKFLILSGLIIQACFFSSSAFSAVIESYMQASLGDSVRGTGAYYSRWASFAEQRAIQGEVCNSVPNVQSYDGLDTCYIYNDSSNTTYTGIGIAISYKDCDNTMPPAGNGASAACTAPPPPLDCSSHTGTKVFLKFSSGGSSFDIDGCGYSFAYGALEDCEISCSAVFTGTGEAALAGSVEVDPAGETLGDFEEQVTLDNNSTTTNLPPDTICDGAGENCVTSETSTEVSTNGTLERIDKNGDTLTRTIKEGATQTVITDTVTTENADGSTTIIENYTVTNNSGDTNTTVTNTTTGSSSSSTSSGSTSGSKETTTMQLSPTGEIESVSVDTEVDFVEPHPSACGYDNFPPCKFEFDQEGVNTDSSSVDATIQSYSTAPDTSWFVMPSFSFSLGNGQACSDSDYYITVYGYSFEPSLCSYIDVLRSLMYWLFSIYTAYSVFAEITHRRNIH